MDKKNCFVIISMMSVDWHTEVWWILWILQLWKNEGSFCQRECLVIWLCLCLCVYPYFAVSGGVSFMLFSVGDSYVEFLTVCENKFPLWDNKGYLKEGGGWRSFNLSRLVRGRRQESFFFKRFYLHFTKYSITFFTMTKQNEDRQS